jgi:hypothetical protein
MQKMRNKETAYLLPRAAATNIIIILGLICEQNDSTSWSNFTATNRVLWAESGKQLGNNGIYWFELKVVSVLAQNHRWTRV